MCCNVRVAGNLCGFKSDGSMFDGEMSCDILSGGRMSEKPCEKVQLHSVALYYSK